MAKQRSNYSWRKPWAYKSYHHMRKAITERFVYRKLQKLERHSAFKQPYKFRSHPLSELNYEFPGYLIPQYPRPPGSGDYPPWSAPPGDCGFACNPSMLDCEGGCTTIACICGIPFISGEILWDETGTAYLEDAGSWAITGILVCIEDSTETAAGTYPTIGVLVVDGAGREVEVVVSVVDCGPLCCDPFTVSGAATVNPGSTWTGTIAPACPDAKCEVTSNSGCSLSCSVNAAGSQVTVTPGAADCGSFTVTVTEPDGCDGDSDSATVRINDTGQGGSWVAYPAGNGSCCSSTTGHCTCNPINGVPIGCTVGKYRYIGTGGGATSCMCVNEPWCCTNPLSERPCGTTCSNPCGQSCATTCPSVSCAIPPGTWTGECLMTWIAQEWKCSC